MPDTIAYASGSTCEYADDLLSREMYSDEEWKDKFKLNSEDIEFIKIAKAKGYTYAKIGIMLGVDGSTIARYHKNSI